MTSSLFFDSIFLLDKISSFPLCPFIYSLNYQTGKFYASKNHRKTCRGFYATNFLLILLGICFPVVNISLYAITSVSKIRFVAVVTNLIVLMFSLIAAPLNFTVMLDAQDVINYMNEAISINERKGLFNAPIYNGIFPFLKSIMESSNKETIKLIKFHKDVDMIGLLYLGNVINVFVATLVWTPAAVILSLDPLSSWLNADFGYLNNHWSLMIAFFTARMVLFVTCVYEIARTNSFFVGWALLSTCMLTKSIKSIRLETRFANKITFLSRLLKKYTELRIFLKCSGWYLPCWAAMALGFMFVTIVIMNTMMIMGWQIFEVYVYLAALPTAIVIVSFSSKMLTLSVCLLAESTGLIKHTWPEKLVRLKSSRRLIDIGWYIRVVKAQQPIIYKSAFFAKVDQEARRTFYAYVLAYTGNCLILFSTQIE